MAASSPDLRLVSGAIADSAARALAVALYRGPDSAVASDEAAALATAAGVDLAAYLAAEHVKGDVGEVVPLPLPGATPRTLLLVGLGDRSDVTPRSMRRAGAALARRARKPGGHLATSLTEGTTDEHLGAFVEGVLLASYSYRVEPRKDDPSGVTAVDLHHGPRGRSAQAALDRAVEHADATTLARDLANLPSQEKTPAWLARRAQDLGREAGLDVIVMEPAELAERGFGGVLAVGSGAGAARGPRFVRIDHAPPKARRRAHVVLVGKGITFDSGGLSLKPNEGMAAMKTDMSGAAAVIAVLRAVGRAGLPLRVTGLVAAAENMPSGTAMRPGDVIRHYGGRTVEVLNTDAEGRLVLADALAYAVADVKPDLVVDIATLTGAIGIALGKRTAGLYATDDGLADALLAAAAAAGEPMWRMPLVDDYRDDLDSPVADLKNIGGRFSGGSITAALFLREFVGGLPWAHLDIAGAARSDADEDERTKGATGYAVRTLLRWLDGLATSR